jgi:predicted metal-dependent HD superfamily phosphohydrolase
MSIFFHDVIYDPQSGTNEEDSCGLVRQYGVEGGVCENDITLICSYIMLTKTHKVAVIHCQRANSGDDSISSFDVWSFQTCVEFDLEFKLIPF